MSHIKSQFVFNAQQRFGILLLVSLNLGLISAYFFLPTPVEQGIDISEPTIVAMQAELDSLRLVAIEARKPKRFPFNPNYLTDYKAYVIGLSPTEFDKLQAFRAQNKWVNSPSDFQRVTGVSDSLLETIRPLFKFPEWITNPKRHHQSEHQEVIKSKTFAEKIDLNVATASQLKEVNGIGEVLSKRIIAYREKLGGFSGVGQLASIWGLKESVRELLLENFAIKTPKRINRMLLSTASASDIATIPGISFELAVEIWEFNKVRDGITTLTELQKIDALSPAKFELIKLYLSVE